MRRYMSSNPGLLAASAALSRAGDEGRAAAVAAPPRPRASVYGLALAACLVWLAGVVAAPWLAHRGEGTLLYALYHSVCHQMDWRSFHLWGEPLAVCHRCFGLYLGFTLGLAVWPALGRPAAWLLARPRRVLLFFVPMLVDVVLWTTNTAASQFLTGAVAAFPVALLVLVALAQIAQPRTSPVRTEGARS